MVQADRRKVAVLDAGAQGVLWLAGQVDCEGWRLINLTTDRPVEARIQWGGVYGNAPEARVTVSRSTKLCVMAQRWSITVDNLDGDNDVQLRAVVLDAHETLCPTFEERAAESPSPDWADHTIPAWATDVRLDTTDQALVGATLQLLDPDDAVRASATQTRLPPWMPLGSAHKVQVQCAAPYRLVWRLQTV